jgi:hypothetical protein
VPQSETFRRSQPTKFPRHDLELEPCERKEGEKRSGLVLPLLDQAVCGFSGGTFDITVTDRSATDIPYFLRAYPALTGMTIGKAIMQK